MQPSLRRTVWTGQSPDLRSDDYIAAVSSGSSAVPAAAGL